jgi:hypothetical protein
MVAAAYVSNSSMAQAQGNFFILETMSCPRPQQLLLRGLAKDGEGDSCLAEKRKWKWTQQVLLSSWRGFYPDDNRPAVELTSLL